MTRSTIIDMLRHPNNHWNDGLSSSISEYVKAFIFLLLGVIQVVLSALDLVIMITLCMSQSLSNICTWVTITAHLPVNDWDTQSCFVHTVVAVVLFS